jgi:hypothetical protein
MVAGEPVAELEGEGLLTLRIDGRVVPGDISIELLGRLGQQTRGALRAAGFEGPRALDLAWRVHRLETRGGLRRRLAQAITLLAQELALRTLAFRRWRRRREAAT